ncbi:MAG TPA: FliM/FliN family flagellar motor switch protein [Candidatus Cybelea sp.]|jgi:hypothetical protein
MKSLGFGAACGSSERIGGKRVRAAKFDMRSALPISAACVVANGVRETLSALLGAPVGMRLFEPCIPSPQAWHALVRDARLYKVRGALADAAVVLRAPDAVVLAATLFGEARVAPQPERRLSPIESDVLDRMVNAIAANLGTVSGARESHFVERITGIAGFVTYFELLVTDPVGSRIGIALSRDPSPERGTRLDAAALAGVTVAARASLDLGLTDVAAVTRLRPGDVVVVPQSRLEACVLMAGSRGIVRGSCGVRNGRYAVAVDARA